MQHTGSMIFSSGMITMVAPLVAPRCCSALQTVGTLGKPVMFFPDRRQPRLRSKTHSKSSFSQKAVHEVGSLRGTDSSLKPRMGATRGGDSTLLKRQTVDKRIIGGNSRTETRGQAGRFLLLDPSANTLIFPHGFEKHLF